MSVGEVITYCFPCMSKVGRVQIGIGYFSLLLLERINQFMGRELT